MYMLKILDNMQDRTELEMATFSLNFNLGTE
jgi:hypothetical protein